MRNQQTVSASVWKVLFLTVTPVAIGLAVFIMAMLPNSEVAKLWEENEGLAEKLDGAKSENKQLVAEVKQLQEDKEEVKEIMASLRQKLNSASRTADQMEKRLTTLQEKNQELNQKNSELQKDKTDLETRLTHLQNERNRRKATGRNKGNRKTIALKQISSFNKKTPAKIKGRKVFGTIEVVQVGPPQTEDGRIRVLGQSNVAGYDHLYCAFDLDSPNDMSIESPDWYRINGTVKDARITRNLPQPDPWGKRRKPSLLLELKGVEATYYDTGGGSTSGGFRAPR